MMRNDQTTHSPFGRSALVRLCRTGLTTADGLLPCRKWLPKNRKDVNE